MSNPLSNRWLFLLAAMALVALVGCSDSDPTEPGGANPSLDTTAPLVINLDPDDHDNGVDLNRDIEILFSEAMDQATVAAALTLSSGTVNTITWNTEGTLATVNHSDWAEATTVTVTVGGGASDLAGNSLPQAFVSTFYTYSSVPAMVGYDFFAPLTEVPPTGYFVVNFSEEMDLNSLLSAYSLTDETTKSSNAVGIIVGAMDGDYRNVRFRWDGQLTPLHTYHFSISTAALTRTGDPLAAGFTLVFTVGTEIDETPPYIVSTVPALDEVVDPALDKIVITFSERIDQSYGTPNSMSALLNIFMAREPVWNDAGDEITLYMKGPLPKGIRFYAVWYANELHDIAGNYSTTADSLSFTTSGEASLFPVREDLRIYYNCEVDKSFPQMARQTFENINSGDFERILNKLTPTGYDEPMEHWFMTISGSNLLFNGYREGSSDYMFTPAVNYLPGPLPATWSGTSTVVTDDGTANLNYTGTLMETYREHLSFDKDNSDGMFLDNCVHLELVHEMVPVGSDVVVEDGTDDLYLCPGLGIIAVDSYGHEYDEGVIVDSWEDGIYLEGAALDDRYEH